MKLYKVQTTQALPPNNQVPGPASCSTGHSTRGYSTRTRLSKGNSTQELLGQDHSVLGHSTSALPGKGQEPQSKGHSTLGHSTHTRLSKEHSIHQLPRQDHSVLGHSTSALPVHGPTDRACQYFRRHRKKKSR